MGPAPFKVKPILSVSEPETDNNESISDFSASESFEGELLNSTHAQHLWEHESLANFGLACVTVSNDESIRRLILIIVPLLPHGPIAIRCIGGGNSERYLIIVSVGLFRTHVVKLSITDNFGSALRKFLYRMRMAPSGILLDNSCVTDSLTSTAMIISGTKLESDMDPVVASLISRLMFEAIEFIRTNPMGVKLMTEVTPPSQQQQQQLSGNYRRHLRWSSLNSMLKELLVQDGTLWALGQTRRKPNLRIPNTAA